MNEFFSSNGGRKIEYTFLLTNGKKEKFVSLQATHIEKFKLELKEKHPKWKIKRFLECKKLY